MLSISRRTKLMFLLSFSALSLIFFTSPPKDLKIALTSLSSIESVDGFLKVDPFDDGRTNRTRYLRCYLNRSTVRTPIFDSNDIINNYSFQYPINIKSACANETVQSLIVVFSSITNIGKRNRMRKHFNYFRNKKYPRTDYRVLYFVGLPSPKLKINGSDVQLKLVNESAKYNDIVQINEVDNYRNVVVKSIAVLEWISEFCQHTKYIVKYDDDTFMDINRSFLSLYNQSYFHTDFIIGDVRRRSKPNRRGNRLWRVTHDEYPGSNYPPFVSSPAIGLPTSTALILYQQALRTKILWLHDIFLTGICAHKLGIPVIHSTHFQNVHHPVKTRFFIYS